MISLIDKFRAWNTKRILRRRFLKKAMLTPHGFKMKGAAYLFSDDWEQQEIRLFKRILKRADRFVNVGANVGLYTLIARENGLPVTALEPVFETIQFLMENLELNNLQENVTVIPAAAGQNPGIGTIYGLGTASSLLENWGRNPTSLAQKVPVVRLDDVIQKPRKDEQLLILMDVEGFEFQALQGSLELMDSHPRPFWIVELISNKITGEHNTDADKVFHLFRQHGYLARTANDAFELASEHVDGVNNYFFYSTDYKEMLLD